MRFVGCALICCSVMLCSSIRVAADGNNLLNICAAAEKTGDGGDPMDPAARAAMKCVAYLNGVTDLNIVYQARLNRPTPQTAFCLPQSFTSQQIVRVVLTFVQAHPELRQRSNIFLVVNALAEAFPCS
jgi:hypothetical protein